jgi:hypothetical protein
MNQHIAGIAVAVRKRLHFHQQTVGCARGGVDVIVAGKPM